MKPESTQLGVLKMVEISRSTFWTCRPSQLSLVRDAASSTSPALLSDLLPLLLYSQPASPRNS